MLHVNISFEKFSPHPFISGNHFTIAFFCYFSTPDHTTPSDFLPVRCEPSGKWKLSQDSASRQLHTPEFLAVTLNFPLCFRLSLFWPFTQATFGVN